MIEQLRNAWHTYKCAKEYSRFEKRLKLARKLLVTPGHILVAGRRRPAIYIDIGYLTPGEVAEVLEDWDWYIRAINLLTTMEDQSLGTSESADKNSSMSR